MESTPGAFPLFIALMALGLIGIGDCQRKDDLKLIRVLTRFAFIVL